MEHPIISYAIVLLCFWLGGVLKGATGVGAPIIAIPVTTALFDVRLAVVAMVLPNLTTNVWQFWRFRQHIDWSGFLVPFVIGGAGGVLLGTVLLKVLPERALTVVVACALLLYISMRLFNNTWRLGQGQARRLGLPAGLGSGLLQGATGLSAPVTLTFLNAMRLERPVFIGSVSLLFIAFGSFQLPALLLADVVTAEGAWLSALAVAAISAGMPLGAVLGRRFSAQTFDRAILLLLVGLTLKLLYSAITL